MDYPALRTYIQFTVDFESLEKDWTLIPTSENPG